MTTDSGKHELINRAIAANRELGAALAELISICTAIRNDLSTAVEAPVKLALNAPQTREEALTAHRRAHRSGRPGKIDADPELEVFIVARIDTHTFAQVTAAVKAHFPPDRHVSLSGVQRWFRNRAAAKITIEKYQT